LFKYRALAKPAAGRHAGRLLAGRRA
jgi:hypothetical protein